MYTRESSVTYRTFLNLYTSTGCPKRMRRFGNNVNATSTSLQSCPHTSTLIHTFTMMATIHHDSSRFELDVKIGVHRDGKKEKPASRRCHTRFLRCLHDSSTVHLRLLMTALRFIPVELRILTMLPRFDTVLLQFKPVAPRPRPRTVLVMNPCDRGVRDTPIYPELPRIQIRRH